MAIIKACIFGLLLFIGLIVVYAIVLAGALEFPFNVVVAVFCGLFMTIAIGLLLSAWRCREEMKIIEESGRMPAFKDGKRIAVSGNIYALNARPIKSPFTQKDCVAYEYKVTRYRGGKSSEAVEVFGYCLIPSVIRSTFGEVRLLAWPDLSDYQVFDVEEGSRRAAVDYFFSTSFRSPNRTDQFQTRLRLTPTMTLVNEIFNDDDGSIRIDCTSDAEHVTPTGEPAAEGEMIVRFDPEHRMYFETTRALTFTEKYVPYGETVCLIGTWSATKQGIIPEGLSKGKATTLFRGNGYEALAKLRGKIIRYVIISPLIMIAINWAVWWMVTRFASTPLLSH